MPETIFSRRQALAAGLAASVTPLSAQPKPVKIGIIGLGHNIYRTFGWACRLMFRKIERLHEQPASLIPMRSIGGSQADHDLAVISLTVERSAPNGQTGNGSKRTAGQRVEHAASH